MQVFTGSLMLVPYTFAPVGYAFCQGQILAISQNTALFSLLGTYYGGNGTSTYGLPNLTGGLAIGQGQGPGMNNYGLGQYGGTTSVTLTSQQAPAHSHQAQGADVIANSASPNNCALGKPSDGTLVYTTNPTAITQMQSQSVQSYGNVSPNPHNNMMPFLSLNWIIALQGIFPPRS